MYATIGPIRVRVACDLPLLLLQPHTQSILILLCMLPHAAHYCFSTTCSLLLNVVLAVSTVCLMSFCSPSCLRAFIGPQGCNIFQGMYAFRMLSASACLRLPYRVVRFTILAFCSALVS